MSIISTFLPLIYPCRDDMGLGKTFQMIATMVSHMPDIDQTDEDRRTTLVVVPAALLQQ